MADVMSTNKYLDLNMLQYYDGKIKSYIADQITEAEYQLPEATAETLGGVKIGTNVNVAEGVISVATATDAALGVAQAGANIDVASGVFSVKTASAADLGVAKAGTNIDVADGVFSVKTASADDLGLAKAGTNIEVANGVFSVKNASASDDGVMSAADFAKLAAFDTADKYALKADIVNAYIFKGSVANYEALPATDLTAGDVYNVQDTGMNYAYNGEEWDALGSTFEVTAITSGEVDALFA